MIRPVCALVLGAWLLAPATAAAQAATAAAAATGEITVVLKSGAVFRGKFFGQDARALKVRSPAGTMREIPRSQIERVEGDMTPPSPEEVREAEATEAVKRAPPAGDTEAPGTRIGMAASLSTLSAGALYLTVDSGGFRFEPGLSLDIVSGDDLSSTAIALGLGLFGLGEIGDQSRAYYGARVGMGHESLTVADEDVLDAWTLFVTPAVGIEWIPHQAVALGVEGQIALGIGSDAFTANLAGLVFVRVFAQ